MSDNPPFDDLEAEAEISAADIADAETDLENKDNLLIAAFLIALAYAFQRGQYAGGDEMAALDDLSDDANERLLDLLSAGAGLSQYATLLRRIHIQASAFGRGGFNQLTRADRDRLTAFMRNELGFLQESLRQFENGDISEAEWQRRIRMYANHVQHSYWNNRTEAKRDAGYRQERRVLHPAEHCGGCVDLAGQGWQDIGTLPDPGDGSTPCGSNDKCGKEYR